MATMLAYVKLDSNVVKLDANASYKETLQVKTISYIPEESLLRAYSEELEWDSLNPIKSDVELIDGSIQRFKSPQVP